MAKPDRRGRGSIDVLDRSIVLRFMRRALVGFVGNRSDAPRYADLMGCHVATHMSVSALVDGVVGGEIDGFPVSRSHAL